MKKIIVLFTVLALVLSLFAGCGSKEENPIGGEVSANTPAPTAQPDPEPEADSDETPVEEDEFDTGIIMGGTYSNEFLGINCNLDSNWIIFDETQMAQINGLTADSIGDEDIKAQFEESGVIYDLYAMTVDGGGTINIALENLGLIYGSVLSEDAYADDAVKQLPEALEASGMSDVVCEKASVQFCGEEHTAINVTCTSEGMMLYETLVCMKVGKYMACVTVCTVGENSTDELLDFFYTGEPRPVESDVSQQPDIETTAGEIEAGEFSVGRLEGNTYINDFLGIQCALDESWIFADVATLAIYNGLSGSTYTTADALALFEQGLTPYDMEASTADGYYTINIVFEKLADIYAATLSPEDYLDISMSQIVPLLESSGYTDVVCEKAGIEFCGETHAGATISAYYEGIAINEAVIVLKVGSYIACITLVCIDDDACNVLAGYFSKID